MLWFLLFWRGVDLCAAQSQMLQQLEMPRALQPHPQAQETLSLLGFWDFGQYSDHFHCLKSVRNNRKVSGKAKSLIIASYLLIRILRGL